MLDIQVIHFRNINLPADAMDKEVWQCCQDNHYYLLTGNRSAKDKADSLHQILKRFGDATSIPVLTVGDLQRVLIDDAYCEACAEAIGEIMLDETLYIGTPRLYIPW